MVSEKIKKNPKKITIFYRLGQQRYFWEAFLEFFRNHNLLGAEVFALRSLHQDASFELSKTVFGQFFKFFIIRGFGGVQKLPDVEKKG